MSIKTPNFGFYSFTTGDTYSAKIDKDRFQTIDNSFAFLSEVIGDGIITGFEIIEDTDGASAVVVGPGIALIDKISTRVFVSKRLNLPDNRTSYIYVRRRVDTIGQFSGFSDFYTLEFEDTTIPLSPIDFKVEEIGDYSISFSWKPSEDIDLRQFEVHRKSFEEDDFLLINTVDRSSESATINFIDDSVKQNASYLYKIRSVDLSDNKSEFTYDIDVSTHPDISSPQPLSDIQVYNGNKSSQILWSLPDDDLISYVQIAFYGVGSDYRQIEEETIVNVDKNSLNYIFLNLSNSANYRALIKTVSINGVSSAEVEKILEPRPSILPEDVSFIFVDTVEWSNSTALYVSWNFSSVDDEFQDADDDASASVLFDPYSPDPYATEGDIVKDYDIPIIDVPEDEDVLTKIRITQINPDGTQITSDLIQAFNPESATVVEFVVTPEGDGPPAPIAYSVLPNQLYLVSVHRYINGSLSLGRFVRMVTKDFQDPPAVQNLQSNILPDTSVEFQWTNPDPSDVIDYDILIYRYPVLNIDYSTGALSVISMFNRDASIDSYYLYRFENQILHAELNPLYASGQNIVGIELFIPSFQIDASSMTIQELADTLMSVEIAPVVNGILSDYINVIVNSLASDRSSIDILDIPSFPTEQDVRYQRLKAVPLPGQENDAVEVDLGDPTLVYDGVSGGISYFKLTPDLIEASSQYDFEVRSRDRSGNVSAYEAVSVLVQAAEFFDRPGFPRNLYASPGDGFVILNWSPPSNSVDLKLFSIYRADAGEGVLAENFIKIDTITSDKFQYIDYTAQNNITYVYLLTSITHYGVESFNPIDDGRIESSMAYMTPRESGVLAAPYDLLATIDGSDVILTWNSIQDSFDGFEVYRSLNSKVDFEVIETIPGSIKEYRDVGSLYQTGVFRYMIRKVINEADIGFTELLELPSFSEFIASVNVSGENISIDTSVGRSLNKLHAPVTEITKEVTKAHRHYKISEDDDRRVDFSEGITIDDWNTGDHDGRVWRTNVDLSIFDLETPYQAYVDEELVRMLYHLDFNTGELTFEQSLAILPSEEGGMISLSFDTPLSFPEIKVVFEANELEGELSSSLVESVSATQFTKNQLTHDMIPEVQHDGRIGEDLIPLNIEMSTLDGYSYYGIKDEDGNLINSNDEEATTPLKLWDSSASSNPSIIFYDFMYFATANVLWSASSIGLIYSEDFGVTWDSGNRSSLSTVLAPHKIFRSSLYNKVFVITNRSVFVSPVPGDPIGGENDGVVSPSGAFSEVQGIAAASTIRDVIEVESDQVTVVESGMIIKKRSQVLVNVHYFQKIGNVFRWEGATDDNLDLEYEVVVNNLTLLELRDKILNTEIIRIGNASIYMKDFYEIELGEKPSAPANTMLDTELILDEDDIDFKIEVPYLDPKSGIFFSTNIGLYRLRYDLYGTNPTLTQRNIFGSSTTNAYAMIYDHVYSRFLISSDVGLLETKDGGESFFLVDDIADQVPIYSFIEEGDYIFAISDQHIYRRDPGRRDFVEIYYTEDFFMRKVSMHYGRIYITTSNGLMVNSYGDNVFSSSNITLNHASGSLVKNGKDMAVHSLRRFSDKLFIGSESALFISTSSTLIYKHWEDPSASIPTVYINGEEQKIGWYILNYATSSLGGVVGVVSSLTFDEKHNRDDIIGVARQYRRFSAKNGGWFDMDYAASVLMYINGSRINDGSRAEKPVYAILETLQKPIDITDTISHLSGANKHLDDLKLVGNILISNAIDSDGNSTELGYNSFTRENVRILSGLVDKFNSQTYFTDPISNEDITDQTKISLPDFTVYLIGGSYNSRHTMSFLGYSDFGEYFTDASGGFLGEPMVGGIITNDEEDVEWLLSSEIEYGDGDSGDPGGPGGI